MWEIIVWSDTRHG